MQLRGGHSREFNSFAPRLSFLLERMGKREPSTHGLCMRQHFRKNFHIKPCQEAGYPSTSEDCSASIAIETQENNQYLEAATSFT